MRLFPRDRIRAWLVSPSLPYQLAAAVVVLTLPALWIGYSLDDQFHRLLLLGKGHPQLSGWQLFSGLEDDPELRRQFIDLGSFPWWVSDGFRLSFFRPLSVLTAQIDFWLWGDSPMPMHLQSLLWFGALVAAVSFLYRRLIAPAWTAGLAALLYAVDDAHAGPAAWLANRNALLACFFGVLCLIAHDRWREGGGRWSALAAPLCLAAALASGEAALGAVGYLFAYAAYRETGTRRQRLATLVPAVVVLATWATLYRLGGYGAHGSGLYLDPLGSPLVYARAIVERVPVNLLGQWSPLPADLGTLLPPELQGKLWWLAVLLVALLALLLWPLCRREAETRFWLLGMALSLLPISAVFPSNRLLFFVGLGAMALLGTWLGGIWQKAAWLPPSRAWRLVARIAAVVLVWVHLPLSVVGMPLAPWVVRQNGLPAEEAAATLPADVEIESQALVLVNAPDYLTFVTYIPTLQTLADRPWSRRTRALSTGPSAVEMARLDSRSVRLNIERGLYAGPLGLLFRDREDDFAVGDRVDVAGLEVTIAALGSNGDPNEIVYRFETPLEDSSRRWLHWVDGAWVEFTVPAVGETLELEAARGPFDLFY